MCVTLCERAGVLCVCDCVCVTLCERAGVLCVCGCVCVTLCERAGVGCRALRQGVFLYPADCGGLAGDPRDRS